MKIKLFYLLIPVTIAPICLIATSCNTLDTQKVKNLGYLSDGFDSYGSLSTYTKNFKSLYYGNKNVNNGNYVVFFGTTGNSTFTYSPDSHTTGTFATPISNPGLTMFSDDVSDWNSNEMIDVDTNLKCDNNAWVLAEVADWKNSGHDYNIKFFSFFYNCKITSYINGAKVENTQVDTQDVPFACSPFQKWTKEDFSNLQYNTNGDTNYGKDKKYWNDWEKKHEEGKYIRNDKQAKDYRNLIKRLQLLSPASFNELTGDDNVIALYYKSGKADSVKTYALHADIDGDMSTIYPENTLKDGNK